VENLKFWALYSLEKRPQYQLKWRLGGLRSQYERCEEEKNILNLLGFEHGIFQLITLTAN
jgi:hypothetical protein